MKKLLLSSVLFSTLFLFLVLFQNSGCKKTNETPPTPVCDVKGFYSGTSTSDKGVTSPLTYSLRDNNFAVGGVTVGGQAVTFGGYRNTCDSVIMSVNYNAGSNYYLLEGKLTNNKATISGTFKNLTTPTDFGTFTISK